MKNLTVLETPDEVARFVRSRLMTNTRHGLVSMTEREIYGEGSLGPDCGGG